MRPSDDRPDEPEPGRCDEGCFWIQRRDRIEGRPLDERQRRRANTIDAIAAMVRALAVGMFEVGLPLMVLAMTRNVDAAASVAMVTMGTVQAIRFVTGGGLDVSDELVEIEVDEVIHSTDKAACCRIDGAVIWLPWSQIDEGSEIESVGDSGVAYIPQWLAKAKGLD